MVEDCEDGEEAEPVEPISKEEAAERLLVVLCSGAVSKHANLSADSAVMFVTGNREDHRRAERDLGGEAEEDRVHPPGEVTPAHPAAD